MSDAFERMTPVERAILTRSSTRSFTAEPVTEAELEALIRAGLAAPWAFHDHPRHLAAVSGRGAVQELAAALNLVLKRPGYSMYAPAAVILVSVGRENDNQKLEVGCVIENIYLRAIDLGLGCCWINQARDICDDERIRPALRKFGVPDTNVVWGMAAVGRPAETAVPRIHQEGTYNIYRAAVK